MPKKRLPAISDRAVWEKVTKGRAGIRWDSVINKVWKDRIYRTSQENILCTEKFGGDKTEVKKEGKGYR